MAVVRNFRLSLLWPAFLLLSAQPSIAAVSPDAMLALLGVGDVPHLLRGEIVSFDVREPNERTLAAGVAMRVETTPRRLIAAVERGALADGDPEVIAGGTIPPSAGPGTLSGLTASESDMAEELDEVEPSSEYNLSLSEIEGFRELARMLSKEDEGARLSAWSSRFREMLWRRLESYSERGVGGIAPYARSGGHKVDVGAELHLFTEQSAVLRHGFPELRTALLKYPAALPPGVASVFQWVDRKVEGRPTPILVHQMLQAEADNGVVVMRDFYVGHSFNSSQLVLGILPYRDGSLVVYSHYTSTDQVAGVGKALKHAIGRERLRAIMVARMERLRAAAH